MRQGKKSVLLPFWFKVGFLQAFFFVAVYPVADLLLYINMFVILSSEPPQIIEKPEVINVTAGDPVSLECKVTGSPELKVKWSKDGNEIMPSRQHSLSFINNISQLKCQSVHLEDKGTYVFEVSNHISACQCKVTLNVIG